MPRKSKVRIPVEETGELTKLGYSAKKNAKTRKMVLKKAAKKYGYQPTMAKVNVLRIFTKRKQPKLHKKYLADVHALEQMHSQGKI